MSVSAGQHGAHVYTGYVGLTLPTCLGVPYGPALQESNVLYLRVENFSKLQKLLRSIA